MKAKLTKEYHTGEIRQNRKEKHFYQQLTVITPAMEDIIIARFYQATSICYCCLWVHSKKSKYYLSGGGKAGGYGYHKPSQALEEAIHDATIELSESIGGYGDDAMERALTAIARACGYKTTKVIGAYA